jgi:hypothetical protein
VCSSDLNVVDPGLAVQSAYAYHELQHVDDIRHMAAEVAATQKSVTLFDLALLGRELIGRTVTRGVNVVPFVPMRAQGWPLLNAHRVRLHPLLDGIESAVTESQWTLFDAGGADRLERAICSGEVR